jgi:RNA polymerase sigma-B factor
LREYARTRDLVLRNELVQRHEWLAQSLARRFREGPGTAADDLLQIARLALIEAVERFDPEHGAGFATFATATILGRIKHHLRDRTWMVQAPRRLRELSVGLRKVRDRLEAELRRSPTVAELAQAAGVSEERLVQAIELEVCRAPLSLEARFTGPSGVDVGWEEVLGGMDPALLAAERRAVLARGMAELDRRHREVIRCRFYAELSQTETAQRLGVSQMHVSRLERAALQRLRGSLADEGD